MFIRSLRLGQYWPWVWSGALRWNPGIDDLVGTAGVVRAVIQNGLLYGPPLRLWYMGPMFRRERPQKGRTRQFNQVGAEVFGAAGPDADAELLAMCQRIWRETGLRGLRLEVNSLGTAEERAEYRDDLHAFLSGRRDRATSRPVARALPGWRAGAGYSTFGSTGPSGSAGGGAAGLPILFLIQEPLQIPIVRAIHKTRYRENPELRKD